MCGAARAKLSAKIPTGCSHCRVAQLMLEIAHAERELICMCTPGIISGGEIVLRRHRNSQRSLSHGRLTQLISLQRLCLLIATFSQSGVWLGTTANTQHPLFSKTATRRPDKKLNSDSR
jgi:hypothetical protein